jgi:hypothetical protein
VKKADRAPKKADRGNSLIKMVVKSGCSEFWSLKFALGVGSVFQDLGDFIVEVGKGR